MTEIDPARYVVTDDSQLREQTADLNRENHTWPDGHPMTEANTEAYTIERTNRGGRPGLGTTSGVVTTTRRRGPSPSISFRVTDAFKAELENVADAEGRSPSDVAREAVEQYMLAHRRAS